MRRLLLLVALAACSHASKHHTPPPAPPPLAEAPTTQGVPGSQDLAPLQSLGARLSEERTHRPPAKTGDQLFAALGKEGITLASHHQVLAADCGCAATAISASPSEAIAIAVCEYALRRRRREGQALMDERYAKLVPDAVRTVNGSGARHGRQCARARRCARPRHPHVLTL